MLFYFCLSAWGMVVNTYDGVVILELIVAVVVVGCVFLVEWLTTRSKDHRDRYWKIQQLFHILVFVILGLVSRFTAFGAMRDVFALTIYAATVTICGMVGGITMYKMKQQYYVHIPPTAKIVNVIDYLQQIDDIHQLSMHVAIIETIPSVHVSILN